MANMLDERRSNYDRPLTTKEAAAYLGMSERWVREMVRIGEIRATKHGRRLYFAPRELAEWVGVA